MSIPFSASAESPVLPAAHASASSTVDVWFLNVGHGDCAVVRHTDGRFTVIDLHLRRSLGRHLVDVSLDAGDLKGLADVTGAFIAGVSSKRPGPLVDDPIAFLRSLGTTEIYRLVLTHPDLDHIRGLLRLRAAFPIRNLWDTHNLKWIPADGFGHDSDSADWSTYQALRFGGGGTTVLRPLQGMSIESAVNDGIQVLSPGVEDVVRANAAGAWNGISYVLKLTHGNASVMFTGDAEPPTLETLVRRYGRGLRANVLKAPHHGRWSGWCDPFVDAVAPDTTVISSGEKIRRHDCAAKYRAVSSVVSTHRAGTVGFRLHRDGRVDELPASTPAHLAHSVGQAIMFFDGLANRRR